MPDAIFWGPPPMYRVHEPIFVYNLSFRWMSSLRAHFKNHCDNNYYGVNMKGLSRVIIFYGASIVILECWTYAPQSKKVESDIVSSMIHLKDVSDERLNQQPTNGRAVKAGPNDSMIEPIQQAVLAVSGRVQLCWSRLWLAECLTTGQLHGCDSRWLLVEPFYDFFG